MKLSIILAPYDSGYLHGGFGLGPEAIISGGLVEALSLNGHDVVVDEIGEVGNEQRREIATGFAVCRAVAKQGRRQPCRRALPGRAGRKLPGNTSAPSPARLRIRSSGPISMATSTRRTRRSTASSTAWRWRRWCGLCWRSMAAAIPGFKAIDPSRCLLVDARDLDPGEEQLLDSLPVLRAQCNDALGEVRKLTVAGAKRTHLHLDLDVHDPDTLQVNRYATPGGPSPDEVRRMMCGVARSMPIAGVTISAYDPAFDPKGDAPPLVGDFSMNCSRLWSGYEGLADEYKAPNSGDGMALHPPLGRFAATSPPLRRGEETPAGP